MLYPVYIVGGFRQQEKNIPGIGVAVTGDELRDRIKALGWSYVEAADKLGMSLSGLQHNLRGLRPIRKQTELLLIALETIHNPTGVAPPDRLPRRSRDG
jgi:transcriptional regulator with XRE-family HTH domain